MTENEIEMAMEGLFLGAARVRAHKYSAKFSRNVHRKLSTRISVQMCFDEKNGLEAA